MKETKKKMSSLTKSDILSCFIIITITKRTLSRLSHHNSCWYEQTRVNNTGHYRWWTTPDNQLSALFKTKKERDVVKTFLTWRHLRIEVFWCKAIKVVCTILKCLKWTGHLYSQVCMCLLDFTFVSMFIENVLTFTDAARWFVLGLLEANCDISTRKICFSITLLWGSHTKQCWAAGRTFTMSGYFSSPLWVNTGGPSITGWCL